MTASKQCPCTSGAPYISCCEPVLSGQASALTAEALMRSRYTAYVEGNTSYLLRTWHPSTRPSAIDPKTIPDWCGLEVVRTAQGQGDDQEGIVEFVATALMHQRLFKLHEVSRFVKEAGQWLYVSGETRGDSEQAVGDAIKVGRNETCPCGSGKKFKKCCGR
jgi:SEC-C motif domain protein